VLGGRDRVERQGCGLLGGQGGRCDASAAGDDHRDDGEDEREGGQGDSLHARNLPDGDS